VEIIKKNTEYRRQKAEKNEHPISNKEHPTSKEGTAT
jgi:hypothetical protein